MLALLYGFACSVVFGVVGFWLGEMSWKQAYKLEREHTRRLTQLINSGDSIVPRKQKDARPN